MQSKTQPKLVDKWIFAHESLPDRPQEEDGDAPPAKVVDARVEVLVSIVKELEELHAAPHATKKVEFLVTCAHPKFKFVGTDIEALRRAAFAECDKHFAITWHNYLLVTVLRSSCYEGIGTGVDFAYNDVKKGITWDGKELLKQRRWGGEVEVKPWPGQFTDRNGRVIACIPATEANKAALEEFRRRIDTLRERLADTLRPEHIEQTLATLSAFSLLPPADSKLEQD